jgi:sulfur carrier protein ThiS
MEILIRFFHGLNRYLPPGGEEYERRLGIPAGSTVDEVLDTLGVPRDHPMVLLVNGHPVKPDHVLRSGDVLSALRPAEGG